MIRWIETTDAIYNSIYNHHKDFLGVFGTITDSDGSSPYGDGEPHIMTEWGFNDADFPIIKCERKGKIEKHYLAIYIKEDEN
jgi:hypothetical protein